MHPNLSIFDLLITPIFILGAFIYAQLRKNNNIQRNPEYQYFMAGLFARIAGSIMLGLVYFFYYGGGDTINYHQTAVAYSKLMFSNQEQFIEGWLASPNWRLMNFDFYNLPPIFHPDDTHSFFVVRLLIPVVTVSCHSYFASAVLTAIITYGGLWKLYQTFLAEFPDLKRELAIACLFIPSCVFWGSGLMKDSFTLSSVGWYTYAFYNFFIKKHFSLKFAFFLILSSTIIIVIKPYIFFALMPGSILWLSNSQIKKIENSFFRIVMGPILISVSGFMGFFILSKMGDALGQYRVDKVLDKAVITQRDMKSDHYGGKAFDIGEFDATATDASTKAPQAIFSGLFRPGIWDVKNAIMLISAAENTYLLLLTILLLVKLKVLGFFKYIIKSPLVLFAMLFSLFFAFSVGLTVANFGSLVRLRIPEMPFFVATLLIIKHYYQKFTGNKLRL